MSRFFNLYKSGFKNYNVTLDDKSPLYHVEQSAFTPGKPELTLHTGSSSSGAVVGVSNFVALSSRSTLGVGDPKKDPANTIWEDLTKESLDHSKYRFEMTIDGERRGFFLTRTHHVGVQGANPSALSNSNFKIVDERTGEVIGAYASNGVKSFKKRGKFQLDRDYGREFEVMFFLASLTIIEKTRRRNQAASGSGGGGGGG